MIFLPGDLLPELFKYIFFKQAKTNKRKRNKNFVVEVTSPTKLYGWKQAVCGFDLNDGLRFS